MVPTKAITSHTNHLEVLPPRTHNEGGNDFNTLMKFSKGLEVMAAAAQPLHSKSFSPSRVADDTLLESLDGAAGGMGLAKLREQTRARKAYGGASESQKQKASKYMYGGANQYQKQKDTIKGGSQFW